MVSERERIEEELRREEARLADLSREQEQARARVEQLRRKLADSRGSSLDEQVGKRKPPAGPSTPAEKIALFRSLFRGRGDVFPRLWINSRSGKRGYSPACSNEWVRGICDKPKVKCGECPNQAFVSVDDQVIRDHLQGRHVVGVYPLLEDETCWFLAVDFDKNEWKEDVAAFVETCSRLELPAAVERSRSGNGAHVWFFFDGPLLAVTARQVASYVITDTMERRHELELASYDRLFPNQDTMPRGGFGNLIALPLQHEARQAGNTVFVDDHWRPITDQWAFLASYPRIPVARMFELAQKASECGRVVGACVSGPNDATDLEPWRRLPSRVAQSPKLDVPLPSSVRAVLAQQVFVETRGLPSPFLTRILRLATFSNPEFYQKQAMRLSTARTPRLIGCAERTSAHIGLPRGCYSTLADLLRQHDVEIVVEDKRFDGAPLAVEFGGMLTPAQQRAARDLLEHEIGVFVAPPGSGKTVVGAHAIAARGRSTLVLVHRSQLLDQWRNQLAAFLGVDLREIGQVGSGKRKVTGTLDVAMIQSLVRRDQVDPMVAEYGHVLVDECHHVSAVSFERVLREVRARHVLGLTATPRRRDGHHPIVEFQLGPVRHAIDAKSQATRRSFEHRLVVRPTAFRLEGDSTRPKIQDVYRRLAQDDDRNRMIVDDIITALEAGRSPIVLTERRDHLEFLVDQLSGVARNLIVLRGGMGSKQRRELREKMASVPEAEERLLIATGRFIGEGFDDARLDTLFLTMPVSWRGTLVQYAGRLHRMHSDKAEVAVFDYVDGAVPMLARMFERREAGYRAMRYVQTDDWPATGAIAEGPVVELDDSQDSDPL